MTMVLKRAPDSLTEEPCKKIKLGEQKEESGGVIDGEKSTVLANDSSSSQSSMSENRQCSDSAKNSSIPKNDLIMSFPERLMHILNHPDEAKDAIIWKNHGDSFWILTKEFTDKVLQVHFAGTKFESFVRKLNRWGFKRIHDQSLPYGTIAYRHDLFQRSRPELIKNMSGVKKKDPILGVFSPQDLLLLQQQQQLAATIVAASDPTALTLQRLVDLRGKQASTDFTSQLLVAQALIQQQQQQSTSLAAVAAAAAAAAATKTSASHLLQTYPGAQQLLGQTQVSHLLAGNPASASAASLGGTGVVRMDQSCSSLNDRLKLLQAAAASEEKTPAPSASPQTSTEASAATSNLELARHLLLQRQIQQLRGAPSSTQAPSTPSVTQLLLLQQRLQGGSV